jgi:hypothetical protein
MIKYYTNNLPIVSLYEKPSTKSNVATQMLYGESFSISQKKKNWLKIKILEDGYNGYVNYKNYSEYLNPTHKVNKLRAKIYKLPNRNSNIFELSFGSKIKIIDKKNQFYKFEKGWINKKDINVLSFKEKNPFKKIKIFKNVKYRWGGKSFKGIDCSGLVQICMHFNNIRCPRDAKDQVKFFKKNTALNKLKKNDLIFWKGHVAVVISKKKLIHAYGPLKKTIIMDISKTLKKIKNTAKLEILALKKYD